MTRGSPFLTHISLVEERVGSGYPFDIPIFRNGLDLELTTPVTILVGENGAGKSTLTAPRIAQFVIATHSPILLALPGATVLSLDDGEIRQVRYDETDHYQLTRSFLEAPECYFRHLLAD